MNLRARVLGTVGSGVLVLGLGLSALPATAEIDDFKQCEESEATPEDDCFDQPPPPPPPEEPPDEPDVVDDTPRRADPNFTG